MSQFYIDKLVSDVFSAKFLFHLGLLRFPPLGVIINLCASSDDAIRPIALKYLLDNFATLYVDYKATDFAHIPFIPALKGNVPCLGKPYEVHFHPPVTAASPLTSLTAQVFANPEWALLDFLVVQPTLRHEALSKLQIKEHPQSSSLVSFLEKTPPKTEHEARDWFGVLAGRISGVFGTTWPIPDVILISTCRLLIGGIEKVVTDADCTHERKPVSREKYSRLLN